jgi:hypothetical protein
VLLSPPRALVSTQCSLGDTLACCAHGKLWWTDLEGPRTVLGSRGGGPLGFSGSCRRLVRASAACRAS